MTYDFNLLATVVAIGIALGAIMGTCAYLILLERKVAAYVQDRLGPNRVGPRGLFQPIADGLKFLLKEDVIPGHVDKLLYLMAPAVAMSTALFAFAVVPFGPTATPPDVPWPTTVEEQEAVQQTYGEEVAAYNDAYPYARFVIAPHVDIGILFVFAVGSLNVYGVILGGWASNNKYSFLGGLRASAQMISYEIPLGISILGVILMTGSLNLERIIHQQAAGGIWFFCYQPLAFLIFMVSAFAETNRLPFDLAEAEQELVGGFHTEYSAMKFAMFFLGEYTHMITTSFLMTILFFGGWHFAWISEVDSPWLVKLLVIAAKMCLFILFFMLIRWTIPRFRFDQLMGLAWRMLIPLTLANLVCVMVIKHLGWSEWLLLPLSLVLLIGAAWITLPRGGTPPRSRRGQVPLGTAATARV